jgi:hypothetical protein
MIKLFWKVISRGGFWRFLILEGIYAVDSRDSGKRAGINRKLSPITGLKSLLAITGMSKN